MKHDKKRKLRVDRQTVRLLAGADLQRANGAAYSEDISNCPMYCGTRTTCNPFCDSFNNLTCRCLTM